MAGAVEGPHVRWVPGDRPMHRPYRPVNLERGRQFAGGFLQTWHQFE